MSTGESQQAAKIKGTTHFTVPIKVSHKHLESTPCFTVGNYCDSPARVLTNNGGLDNVATLYGSQHRKYDGAVLATPHNMILEFFSIDSRTWGSSDIDKWEKLPESQGSFD